VPRRRPPGAPRLTETSYAILGHLALRPWSAYDLSRSVNRSVRWFWSRAESRIYAEAARLVAGGLARAEHTSVGARPRTVYSITAKGREALAAWLHRPTPEPGAFALHFEPLLRVHLARAGTREDLLRALEDASSLADTIHRQGREVATEFLQGRHLLQEEAHIRALVFDFLWSLADEIERWAARSRAEVEQWADLDAQGRTERGLDLMRAAIRADGPGRPARPG
jgi:PadR family transcriptional regulator, regulatory protein AphA